MPRALFVLSLAAASMSTAACYKAPPEALQLEGNLLRVSNDTRTEWTHVEIWINQNYRMVTPSIPPGGRFQATLDTFVTGFGRRFDMRRQQITDVKLVAKLPDGKPLELHMPLSVGGLEGALGGKR